MKISVPLQDPLSLPHGEQPAKRSCRQYSAITCSVLESLDCPKEKQQLWWNRLGPASSTDCVPPDDRAMAKETLNCIQPRLTWNYVASDSDHKLQRLAQVTSSPFQGQRQGHVEFVQDHTSPAETDVTMEKFVDRRHTDPSLSDEERCSPSSVLISESHCEQQCPESASENASLPRLKFLCSFGGRIMARPVDGKLRYAGGETRIVSVCKGISFTEFMSKMSQVYGYPLGLKYQLPDQELDALISVSSDDDLQNMVEEHDKIEPSGVASSRLRLFFFTTPADVELADAKVESGNCVSFPDQRYVDAINGLPAKHQANLPEEDTPALHPMVTVNSTDGGGRIPSLEQANEVTQCSAISSSPSSPLTSGQTAFRKPPGLLDLSLQNVNESHCKATMASFAFEGEIDQDVLGGSLSTPFHYHYDPSHFDLPFSQVTDSSPRISVPDGPSLRNGENRPGLHRVDSKSGIAYLPDHEYRSSLGPPLEHWQEGSYVHDLTSPQADHQHGNQLYTVSLASPHQSYHSHPHQQIQHQHHHQHQHQQQHHQLYIHQPQQQYHRHQQQQHHHGYQEHQSHQHQGSWSPRNERDADRGEYAHQEVHKQSQYHQFSHHHLVRNSPVPASCSWNAEHPGTPRSNQLSAQVLHGLAPAPPYQMGSAPCPSQGVHDYQAKCPCGLQHSQVHRGITVSIGEQPYTRRPAFQDDHGARKQALRTSSRFYDNGTHGVDAGAWQQANHSILPCEVEHKESNNEWPLRLGRHLRDLQSPDCSARNQNVHYNEPRCRNGEILPAHERPEIGMGCLCSNCADNRRQQMEMAKGHSAYMEVSDCAPDQSLSRKGFDLDVGRVATCQPVFPRAPAPKDEEQSNVHEKIFEVEPGLGASQLRWDPDSRLQIATHIDRPRKVQLSSGTATGSFGVSNKPMLPLVPRAAQRSSNLTKTSSELAISRSLASSEARYHYDIPPCQQGQQMQLGKDLQTMVLDESLPEATGEEDLNKHFGLSDTNSCASMSISFCWDDVSSGPGRVESDARHPWSPNCKLDWADQGANDVFLAGQRDLQLSSPDVITLGSVVEVSNSGQVLDSHIFAQSPYRSANMSKFSFAAGKPLVSPQDRIVDKEPFAPDMSVTGELADSMASSVLDCCSDETMAWEMSDLDQESASLPREEEKVTKAKEDTDTISGEPNIGKLQLGEDCEDKLASMNGEALKDVMEVVIDEVGVTKGLLEANTSEDSGVTLVILSGGQSDKTSHQKEAVITERNGPSLSQAEAEAITRGLQIIRNSDLEDTKELGSGTYGTVYHGKWRGSDVAIKRIKASCFTGPPADQERLITDFWREACTLGQLHHPNVVAFYGVVPDGPGGTLATVTEYMVNGSLKQVLHKKDRTIDRRKRLFIAMDAAFGMEYLHSKNIVHFDLKCENLLVNMKDAHRPICKVGDFGLSKVKHHTLVSGGVRGTLPWMAPELLSGNGGMVSEKVDIFSFGIVMWELLTGEEPYANMHCGAIIGGIANNTLRPSIPSWCDPGWRSIMERCWSDNPADRPPFAEIAKELRAIAATMNLK